MNALDSRQYEVHFCVEHGQTQIVFNPATLRFPNLSRGKWFFRPLFIQTKLAFETESADVCVLRSEQFYCESLRDSEGSETKINKPFTGLFETRQFSSRNNLYNWYDSDSIFNTIELVKPIYKLTVTPQDLFGNPIPFRREKREDDSTELKSIPHDNLCLTFALIRLKGDKE